MKKIITRQNFLGIALCISIGLFSQALFAESQTKNKANGETVYINSYEQFLDIAEHPDNYDSTAKYKLTKDLDFPKDRPDIYIIPPLFPKGFSGTFDGKDENDEDKFYSITFPDRTQDAVKIDIGDSTRGPSYGGGLFAYVKSGATIENLYVYNYNYKNEIPGGRNQPGCLFVGSIAGYSVSSTFTNVHTYDAYIRALGSIIYKKNQSEVDVGGLVGYAYKGIFTSCAYFAEETNNGKDIGTYATPMSCVGGLVGRAGASTIDHCVVDALNDSINIYCDWDQSSNESSTSPTSAFIYYRYCAGGMVGWLYGKGSHIMTSAVLAESNKPFNIRSYLAKIMADKDYWCNLLS